MDGLEYLRAHVLSLPSLAKFVVGTALIVAVPALAGRVRLPAAVGLLLSGVVVGPHGLDIFGEQRPIADFLADLGKLLLMFCAGLPWTWRSFATPCTDRSSLASSPPASLAC